MSPATQCERPSVRVIRPAASSRPVPAPYGGDAGAEQRWWLCRRSGTSSATISIPWGSRGDGDHPRQRACTACPSASRVALRSLRVPCLGVSLPVPWGYFPREYPQLHEKQCSPCAPMGTSKTKKPQKSAVFGGLWRAMKVGNGAPGRTRTSTPVKATDFESAASTNSATGALSGSFHAGNRRESAAHHNQALRAVKSKPASAVASAAVAVPHAGC